MPIKEIQVSNDKMIKQRNEPLSYILKTTRSCSYSFSCNRLTYCYKFRKHAISNSLQSDRNLTREESYSCLGFTNKES